MRDVFPVRGEWGVQGQHLLVVPGGHGGVVEEVVGLTPGVTGHVGRS